MAPIDRVTAEVRTAALHAAKTDDACFLDPPQCDREKIAVLYAPRVALSELTRLDNKLRDGIITRPNVDPNLSYRVIEKAGPNVMLDQI